MPKIEKKGTLTPPVPKPQPKANGIKPKANGTATQHNGKGNGRAKPAGPKGEPALKPTGSRSSQGVSTPLYYEIGSPNYLLDVDMRLLRDISQGYGPEKADLQVPKDVDLGSRLRHMTRAGWIEHRKNDGKPDSSIFTGWVVTPKGRDILKAAKDVEFGTKELRLLTDDIRDNLDMIAALKTTREEAQLEMLRCRHAIGTALRQVKKTLPHGWWLAWLKANVAMSEDTAERHMRYSKSAFTRNLAEEKRKWREINGNKPKGGTNAGKETGEETSGVICDPGTVGGNTGGTAGGKTRTGTGTKGESRPEIHGVELPFTVPERERWKNILTAARKHFKAKEWPDCRVALEMAEDWLRRIVNDA